MADEIKVTFQVTYSSTKAQGGLKDTIAPGSLSITQTNPGRYGGVQLIPSAGSTTIKALAEKQTNEGLLYVRNLDTANFVTYGSSLLEFKLKPGEFHWVRPTPGATIQMKADTADCKVDTRMYED